jgi:undecaprenyl-diphosphatase
VPRRRLGYYGFVLSALYRPAEDRRPGRTSQRGLAGRLTLGATAAVLVAIPFTLLMVLVLSEWEPLERLDRTVADRLHEVALGNPALVDVLEVGEVVTSPWLLRVVVLAVAVWLWRRGARRLAAWAVVTVAVGGLLGALLKLVVERARPVFPEPVATSGGYSFPSGHALNSLLIAGVLLLVFLPVLRPAGKALAVAVGVAFVLFTGYDRIALGVHFVSDVVAGWIAALACLAGTAAAFEIWRREHGRAPSTVAEGVEPEAARTISDPPAGRE